MRILMFYHSLLSDWNHGNAHFLRGIATELVSRGHEVRIFEPENSWSLNNLMAEHGEKPLRKFRSIYPRINSIRYDLSAFALENELDEADMVIVHEWSDHGLVKRIGRHRARHGGYKLFFHDTHHRMVTEPDSMAAYDLTNYDGVLAYGKILQEMYERRGNVSRAWTWHEAADTRVFKPLPAPAEKGDLVWVGNWGDDERTAELQTFLINPVSELELKARIHGVRYPEEAKMRLQEAGIEYAGWLPNFEAPRVFSEFKVTVHVPRRPYTKALPGIPTIRPFEALACGIPMISSPWDDVEGLFRPGRDFLIARNGEEMKRLLKLVLNEPDVAQSLTESGLETIRARHTCAHRVDELLAIHNEFIKTEPTHLPATTPQLAIS
ncbi:MAG: glycosyltransferase [Limisphaerales bacterium]